MTKQKKQDEHMFWFGFDLAVICWTILWKIKKIAVQMKCCKDLHENLYIVSKISL